MNDIKSNQRILYMTTDRIYLNNKDFISMTNTNLPFGKFVFKEIEIYWLVTIEKDPNSKLLTIHVENYDEKVLESFSGQEVKGEVGYMCFVDLEWAKLEPLLFDYEELSFRGMLKLNFDDSDVDVNKLNEYAAKSCFGTSKMRQEENIIFKTSDFTKRIKFKDAIFKDGCVYVSLGKVSGVDISFEIKNDKIRQEFDSIKYYFYKVFGSREFTVTGKYIVYKNSKYDIINPSSTFIADIDEQIVDQVREIQILSIPKIINKESVRKKLVTPEEVYELLKSNEENSTILVNSEKEIVETLISKVGSSKNKNQLTFISGSLQNNYDKIQFTLNPKFGFLFSVSGKKNTHYCWELMDSHATYIWSISNEIDLVTRKNIMEKEVNMIIKIGRNKYKSQIKSSDDVHSFVLTTISHFNSKNNSNDRFVEWKNRFLEIVV